MVTKEEEKKKETLLATLAHLYAILMCVFTVHKLYFIPTCQQNFWPLHVFLSAGIDGVLTHSSRYDFPILCS